jgi:branched-chain amino acid transport system permease protein
VLGLHPHRYKLMAFVLSSFLATAGGVVYLLLQTGPTPHVTSADFTLTLLIMVVLGGAGTKWGAMIGGVLYTYLNNRLGAVGDSSLVQDLPDVLRTPLSEPLFLLGTLFVLIVFFAPGGIAGLASRGQPTGLRRIEESLRSERATTTAPVQTTEEGA